MDSDGVEEALEAQLRILVTAAGHIGERIARARAEQLHQAQSSSQQQARWLQARLDAERQSSLAELSTAHEPNWWETADAKHIARKYELASAWAAQDPAAAQTKARIEQELSDRYGVNLVDVNPVHVQDAIAEAQAQQDKAAAERAEASRLLEAERHERKHHEASHDMAQQFHHQAHQSWDSAARREQFARQLEAKGLNPQLIATRMRADISQATPPQAALSKPAGATQARKTHSAPYRERSLSR